MMMDLPKKAQRIDKGYIIKIYMVEIWQSIREGGKRMWQSVTAETPRQGEQPLTPLSFFPSRGFDDPAGINTAAILEASLRRREREELGVPTTAEMIRGVGIGQEGFISTNRLLWIAGMVLTWGGSGAAAYRAAEILMGNDDASGSLRVAGSLVTAFIATSIVNELFLRRLVRPK